MASRNMNKIKPWMLAKNTNEIVNSYVQKIYKQMPMSFNKDLKTIKVATPKAENRGPLSTWKNQQKQMPLAAITPRTPSMKKSSSKLKQQHSSNVASFFKSNKSGQQVNTKSALSALTSSKRLLKTPNYKIYKSLRYGSSCSSSRSSIFKRYDERKRQRQSSLAQINYLIRSFHTSKFEPTYARFLMPARNQQRDTALGSIPNAIKFSNNMLKDLMKVDTSTREKLTQHTQNVTPVKPTKQPNLETWHHPPSLSKYKLKTPTGSVHKNVNTQVQYSSKKPPSTPQNRDYARLNVGRSSQYKHPKTPNELFIAQHDRHNTELHEKHRRNRMKKLGLIKSPTASEKFREERTKQLNKNMPANENPMENNQRQDNKPNAKQAIKTAPKLCNQAENIPPLLIENNSITKDKSFKAFHIPKHMYPKTLEKKQTATFFTSQKEATKSCKQSCIPVSSNKTNSIKATSSKYTSFINSPKLPTGYTTISPLVALRAQMPNKNDLGSYRYHRHDFFSTNKY